MCGIVGYVSSFRNGFSKDEAEAFRDMLFVDTLRGWDATGVFGVDNNLNVALVKEASDGPTFIRSKEFDTFLREGIQRGVLMVGHNRAATRGDSAKDENAHPFKADDKIVLVQNGTYHGNWKHHADTEVDTEAIAHCLAKEPDISKALQMVNAAYALVWYDVSKETLFLIRNNQRPLYVAQTKRGSIMFASESTTILYAAARNGLTLENGPPEQLPAGELVSIKLNSNGGWTRSQKPIDYAYKTTFLNSDNDDAYAAWWNAQPQQNQRQISYPAGNKSNQVGFLVSDLLKLPSLKDVWMTREQQLAAMKWGTSKRDKKILVELFDYRPANDSKDCRAFVVMGHPIDPAFGPDDKAPVIYWILTDKDETEIIDYVSAEYYVVQGGSALDHGGVGFQHDGQMHFLCYMFGASAVRASLEGYDFETTH